MESNDPKAKTFSGTGRELMRINMVSGIHGVQEIAFNPLSKKGNEDYGLLYIGVGDGGAVENGYQFLAHDKEKVWGSILRHRSRWQKQHEWAVWNSKNKSICRR
jgi:hypothetical protein